MFALRKNDRIMSLNGDVEVGFARAGRCSWFERVDEQGHVGTVVELSILKTVWLCLMDPSLRRLEVLRLLLITRSDALCFLSVNVFRRLAK